MNSFFKYFLISLTLSACQSSDVAPTSDLLGYDFYPISKGIYNIYQVNETRYLISGEIEIIDYQIKEEIIDSFLSAEDSTYIINRYSRNVEIEDWESLNTWQIKKNDYQIVVFEENTPFVKLSFPIQAGKKWNGNAYNTFEQDDYTMDSLFFPYLNQYDLLFEKTLKVIQNDNQDYIVELDKRTEIYALNVGLIEKEVNILTFCAADNCLGQQIIEIGLEYKQVLIEYGKN
jgi:hypothetical protein